METYFLLCCSYLLLLVGGGDINWNVFDDSSDNGIIQALRFPCMIGHSAVRFSHVSVLLGAFLSNKKNRKEVHVSGCGEFQRFQRNFPLLCVMT